MIGRGDKTRATQTKERRMAAAVAAQKIDRLAGGWDRRAADRALAATVLGKRTTVPTAGLIVGEAVLPEVAEDRRERLVPALARTGTMDRAEARQLRSKLGKQNEDLPHRNAAPLPAKTIVRDHGAHSESAHHGVVPGAAATGARKDGIPTGDLRSSPGNRGGALPAGQMNAVRDLPGVLRLGVVLIEAQTGVSVPAVGPRVVARQGEAAPLP
jgi:hypothetical protein